MHGKSKIAPAGDRAGYAGAIGGPEGFNIDIAEAKAFRDMEHRRLVLMRKDRTRTAAEIREKSELEALISKRAAEFVRPRATDPTTPRGIANQLHQLNCKRLWPPSHGGGELKGAEDEEEAFLTARVAAFWHSPEGRDRKRMRELEFKGIGSDVSLSTSKRNWIS